MKEYSIGTTCSPCVGFKYGCHEDKGIPCVLASRSSVWRYICDMIKKKKWRWSSYVELNISHALSYVSMRRYKDWVGQVQDEHLKWITCLKLAVHLVIMDMWRCASMELSHHSVWGSICESSRSNNDQVRNSGLSGAWRAIIEIKRDAQGKGMALLGFPFTGLKVVVGRPDYRIDSRTIKRGFRLGNLITSS